MRHAFNAEAIGTIVPADDKEYPLSAELYVYCFVWLLWERLCARVSQGSTESGTRADRNVQQISKKKKNQAVDTFSL